MTPTRAVNPDFVVVESVRGVAASMVLTLTNYGAGGVYDLTGLTPLCEIWSGDPNDLGSLVEVPSAANVVAGTITLSWTMAQSLAVPVGRYGLRLRLFSGAECVDQLLNGQWLHQEV